jgi:hypothetical protein
MYVVSKLSRLYRLTKMVSIDMQCEERQARALGCPYPHMLQVYREPVSI